MATLSDLMYSWFSGNKDVAPTAANVLDGFQSVTATTGATTLVTVPAGRTWVGKIGASVSCHNAAAALAAGQAKAIFSVVGVGATPPAGNVFAVTAQTAANAATGAVGVDASADLQTDFTLIAPASGGVQIQVTTTISGTGGECDSFAIGQLI